MTERPVPHSEATVIAGLLHHPDVRSTVSVRLHPEHFTHPTLVDAYRVILDLHAAGMEIGAAIVTERLSDEHRSRVDDAGYLAIDILQPPRREDIDRAVNEILKAFARRQIASLCEEILADPDSLITILRSTVYESDSEAVSDAFVRLVAIIHDSAAEPWSEPERLPANLLPVEPFDHELLPEVLRDLVNDITERMQCPPDYVAVALMIVLATVVGRKIGIRPKKEDDWLVVVNLWGAVIGRPSVLKSPAIKAILELLVVLEIEAKEIFEEAQKRFEHELAIADAAAKENESRIRKELKRGESQESVARSIPPIEGPEAPTRGRYIVNDSTVEKLGVILDENPNGVLVFRDELIGLLRSLDREKQEQARAFYLEAWNGTGRFTYDRIGRGTIDIEAAIVSLLGAIPPGPLRRYICEAIEHGVGDDGLAQRFQLSVYPDIDPNWKNVDRPPNKEARRRVMDLVRDLNLAAGKDLGGVTDDDPDGRDAIPYLRFDDEAQPVFDQWRTDLELRLREPEEHPALESHLGKFRSLVPSMALLLHLAEGGRGPVTRGALDRAIAWAKYLESHARRIYAATLPTAETSVRALARRLLARKLPVPFSLRDVYRKGWADLRTKEQAQEAVDALLGMGWLRVVSEKLAKKTVTVYLVNPRIYDPRPEQPDKPPGSRDEARLSGLSVGSTRDSSSVREAPEENLSVVSAGSRGHSTDSDPSSTSDSVEVRRTDTDRTDTEANLSVLSACTPGSSRELSSAGTDSAPPRALATPDSGETARTDTGRWADLDHPGGDLDSGESHQLTADRTDRFDPAAAPIDSDSPELSDEDRRAEHQRLLEIDASTDPFTVADDGGQQGLLASIDEDQSSREDPREREAWADRPGGG